MFVGGIACTLMVCWCGAVDPSFVYRPVLYAYRPSVYLLRC